MNELEFYQETLIRGENQKSHSTPHKILDEISEEDSDLLLTEKLNVEILQNTIQIQLSKVKKTTLEAKEGQGMLSEELNLAYQKLK